jgi:ribosomal protein S18 acetylase RimI-like enzyme
LPVPVRFGAHATDLRWLEQGDAPLLMAFFASHSPETVYQRYGYAGVHMTPERAAQLVGVDQSRDAALGIFERGGGLPRLIAIGRYCLSADGRWAEAAFVVHEQRRRLGICSTLLDALVTIARERGLYRLVGEVQHDNAPMLDIFRAAGATIEWINGTPSLRATIVLRDSDPGSAHPLPGAQRSVSSRGGSVAARAARRDDAWHFSPALRSAPT